MSGLFGGPFSAEELTGRYGLGGVTLGIRERCIASPLFLASAVLSCMWEQDLLATPSAAHREVECAMIDQVDTLYVDARGTAKTTLLDEVGTVWQGLKYPNDTQLLTHSTDKNARSLSRSARLHFTMNPRLRAIFPEYAMRDAGDEGNILAWSFPCRTLGGREESVEVGTPGMQTAGRHYTVVRCSDWMNENTTPLYGLATLEMMNSLVALFSQVQGLLKGREVCDRVHFTIDSNRWHDADLAGTLMRRDKAANRIRKVIRGVTRAPDGTWISSWPEVKTPAMIQAIYESPAMTSAMWAANFCSDPLPEGGMTFLREWFKPYARAPKDLDVAITVDLAWTQAKKGSKAAKNSDRTGIVCSGVAPGDGNLFVLEIAAGHWSPDETVERIFAMADFWKPKFVGIEKSPGSVAVEAILEADARRTGRYLHTRELKTAGHDKAVRMGPLHRIAQHWGIYVKPEHEELVEELLRFGVSDRDDLADALAHRALDLYMPRAVLEEKEVRLRRVPSGRDDTADGLMRRMNETFLGNAKNTFGRLVRLPA